MGLDGYGIEISVWGDCMSTGAKNKGTNMCHTKSETAPWIGIDYGTTVNVQEVIILGYCCGEQTQDVHVRISDDLPTSSEKMFSSGTLLGRYKGYAYETIRISGRKDQSLLI